jgi:hypothetical protein
MFRELADVVDLVEERIVDVLRLKNGIDIEVRAASFRRLRGLTAVAVIASECAFWQSEESANADADILAAVRPSLSTTQGPLILITTPYARRGGTCTGVLRPRRGPEHLSGASCDAGVQSDAASVGG